MKHLLMIAIGCTSLASLIAAAPPARSQSAKFTCPPPYYWVDVNKISPFFRKNLRPVNGKIKMLNPPCVDSEQLKKELAKPVFYRYGEFDTYYCGGKPKTCKHIRVDPKLIKLRAPHTPSVSPTAPSIPKQSHKSPANSSISRKSQPKNSGNSFNGIFDITALRLVKDTKDKPWSPRAKLLSTFLGVDGEVQCSGTLIGSRHVLTAAHCVMLRDKTTGKLLDADRTLVIPSLNANSAPYGSFLAKGSNARTPSRYVEMMSSSTV